MGSFPLTTETATNLIVSALRAIAVLGMVRAALGLLSLPWVEWQWHLADDVWLMAWFSVCAAALYSSRQQFAACCALLGAAYSDAPLAAAGFDPSWLSVQAFFVPVLWVIALEQPVPIESGRARRAAEAMAVSSFAVAAAQLAGMMPSDSYWLILSALGVPAIVTLTVRVKLNERQFSVRDAYVCMGVLPIAVGLVVELLSILLIGRSIVENAFGVHLVGNLALTLVPLGALVETYGSGRDG